MSQSHQQYLNLAEAALERSFSPNSLFKLIGFNEQNADHENLIGRLKDCGFRENESIQILGWTPFRGTLICKVGNITLALRETEAAVLRVQKWVES